MKHAIYRVVSFEIIGDYKIRIVFDDNSSQEINFQEIMPWLRSRLVNINSLDCVLTKKINIEIYIPIRQYFIIIKKSKT